MSALLGGAFGLLLACAPALAQETRSVKQQEADFQRRQHARDRELADQRRAAARAQPPANERERAAACRIARNDLENLQGGAGVTFAQQREARDRIALYCP